MRPAHHGLNQNLLLPPGELHRRGSLRGEAVLLPVPEGIVLLVGRSLPSLRRQGGRFARLRRLRQGLVLCAEEARLSRFALEDASAGRVVRATWQVRANIGVGLDLSADLRMLACMRDRTRVDNLAGQCRTRRLRAASLACFCRFLPNRLELFGDVDFDVTCTRASACTCGAAHTQLRRHARLHLVLQPRRKQRLQLDVYSTSACPAPFVAFRVKPRRACKFLKVACEVGR